MAAGEVTSDIHVGSKRFVHPDRLPEFKLTPRVLALLAYTAKHRLISSDDLARLDGGSEQKVKRELRTLWANRYLLRPSVQLNTVAITGPQPLVYGLSNRGARLLRDHGHLIDTDIDWSENCRRAGVAFIDHSVARSRFMAALDVAQRDRADIDLLEAATIIARAPEKTQRARYPLKWVAQVPDGHGGEVAASVISDDLFGLVFGDDSASYFAVESIVAKCPCAAPSDGAKKLWRESADYGRTTCTSSPPIGTDGVNVDTRNNSELNSFGF